MYVLKERQRSRPKEKEEKLVTKAIGVRSSFQQRLVKLTAEILGKRQGETY